MSAAQGSGSALLSTLVIVVAAVASWRQEAHIPGDGKSTVTRISRCNSARDQSIQQGEKSMEPCLGISFPHYRAIVALDIERSTCRPDPVKAELRNKLYELVDAAFCTAGIRKNYRDQFIDRGDGILALIHPVDQAPKALLLNRVIPVLTQLLTDYNASLSRESRSQRQLRVRVVVHAGEVHYDANGCFGEALDIAFRLLDSVHVKKVLRTAASPLTLVISGDIFSTVVRHGYEDIDQRAFFPLVRVCVADHRYAGWVHVPEEVTQGNVVEVTNTGSLSEVASSYLNRSGKTLALSG